MSRRRFAAIAVFVVGLALALNGYWLLPNEGETMYRYERTPVTVEDGALTYDSPREHPVPGELRAVDCQTADRYGRACALDRRVVASGNLTVAAGTDVSLRAAERDYARVEGAYYERTVVTNATHATYGLERLSPRDLRAAIADEVPPASAYDSDDFPASAPATFRAAVTGDPVFSPEAPYEAGLGELYVQEGSYYTVVQTGERERDRPLVSHETRPILAGVGVVTMVVGVLLMAPDLPTTERRPGRD
jgi:hypothetical protein